MRADTALEHGLHSVLQGASGWLATRRWFGDKARRIERIDPIVTALIEREDGHLALVIAEVTFDDGGSAQYFLPALVTKDATPDSAIGQFPINGDRLLVVEASSTPVFQRWFIEQAAASARLDTGYYRWLWDTVGAGADRISAAASAPARVLGGEQSNTSLLYGDSLIIKLFRMLQPGINPDLEIGAFLATRTDFAHVPTLLGMAELHDEQRTSVAAIQAYQPNQGDGWSWFLDQLRSGGGVAEKSTREAIGRLGERTAELHIALASDSGHDDFRPEPLTEAALAAHVKQVRRELSETMRLLKSSYETAIDLDGLASRLFNLIQGLEGLQGTVKIRVHGDFHLGQVLRTTDGDFSILDFEGEPSRPIAERRQKSPALRDVAGMLRSIDYACAMINQERVSSSETRPGGTNRGLGLRDAFLSQYVRCAKVAQVPIVPNSASALHRSLHALELEKALYEVRYELNNRPDWVSIPLGALQRVV